MSICPNCGNKVKQNSANKHKVKGVWIHKNCKQRRFYQVDIVYQINKLKYEVKKNV